MQLQSSLHTSVTICMWHRQFAVQCMLRFVCRIELALVALLKSVFQLAFGGNWALVNRMSLFQVTSLENSGILGNLWWLV